MLYVTGIAENLFDEAAEELMPRVSLLTRVQITGAVYVKSALQLRMTSNEKYSPYNPPLRYLHRELADLHNIQESSAAAKDRVRAKLISTQLLSESVRTFTFELSAPVHGTLPGGFGIFDFSEHFDSTYQHMDEENPQSLNDDYIRTWTISGAASFNIEDGTFYQLQQLNITVKHKDGGAVSSLLHAYAPLLASDSSECLSVDYVGSGGAFSCFSQQTPGELPTVPSSMLWIAGGVGITPFMSMWDGIVGLDKVLAEKGEDLIADIVLVFAARDDDLELLRHFLLHRKITSDYVQVRILGFQSLSQNTEENCVTQDALIRDFPDAPMVLKQERIDSSSLASIDKLAEREIYLCGPEGFMRHTETLLQAVAGADLNVQKESYSF